MDLRSSSENAPQSVPFQIMISIGFVCAEGHIPPFYPSDLLVSIIDVRNVETLFIQLIFLHRSGLRHTQSECCSVQLNVVGLTLYLN